MKIKNIIFDFGGVLLDIDPSLSFNALAELLHCGMPQGTLPEEISDILLAFELGHINTEKFFNKLQSVSKGKIPSEDNIRDAWNKMLLGWNPARFAFLDKLKQQYNVYLLSNTNAIHMEWELNDLKHTYGIDNFDDRFFVKTYYSHLINMRKPDIEIYEYVINDALIEASESIFIDDRQDNIESAGKAGLKTALHDPNTEIIEVFDSYLRNI